MKRITDEEKEKRYQEKKKKDLKKMNEQRQITLKKLFESGDVNTNKCECGKYYDCTPRFNPRNKVNISRKRCTKCPLKPEFKFKKVFLKKDQVWKELKVRY